jgi:hypothetical protein
MGNKHSSQTTSPPLLSINKLLEKLQEEKKKDIFMGVGEKSKQILDYEKNFDLLVSLLEFLKNEQTNVVNPVISEEDLRENINSSFKESISINTILDDILRVQTPRPVMKIDNKSVQNSPSVVSVESTPSPSINRDMENKLRKLEQQLMTAVPEERLHHEEKRYKRLKQISKNNEEELINNLKMLLDLNILTLMSNSKNEKYMYMRNFSFPKKTGFLSSNRKILLLFQGNGDLVSYDVTKPLVNNNDGSFQGEVIWSSNTARKGVSKVEIKNGKMIMNGTYTSGRINPKTKTLEKSWDYQVLFRKNKSFDENVIEVKDSNDSGTWKRIL